MSGPMPIMKMEAPVGKARDAYNMLGSDSAQAKLIGVLLHAAYLVTVCDKPKTDLGGLVDEYLEDAKRQLAQWRTDAEF